MKKQLIQYLFNINKHIKQPVETLKTNTIIYFNNINKTYKLENINA